MLTMTPSAGARLTLLLDGQSNDAVCRIVRLDRRLKLRKGHVCENDRTFTHDGRVVLAVDEKVSAALESRKLDVRETERGPRLKLRPIGS